ESARDLDDASRRWKAAGHGFFCFTGRRVVPAVGLLTLNPRSTRRRIASDRFGKSACWRRQSAIAAFISLVMAHGTESKNARSKSLQCRKRQNKKAKIENFVMRDFFSQAHSLGPPE